jgi:hypothetical protein
MERLNRGDKIYLDKNNEKESCINTFLATRDAIIECCEYNDSSGYGSKTRLFICEDYKHECTSVVRQVWNSFDKEWMEESMEFDSDSFRYLQDMIKGNDISLGSKYSIVRES